MALAALNSNDVKIYNLTAGAGVRGLLWEQKRRLGKLGAGVTEQSAQFLQDFDFPSSSSHVLVSPDQRYILAAGQYKPSLKIFETAQLALKCARGINSEVVDICFLGDDYRKIALASVDRHVELHAQYGRHFKTRVPRQPRCLAYADFTSELFVGASGAELYRLSLDQGRFFAPIALGLGAVEKLLLGRELEVLFAAGEGARVELLDLRAKGAVCALRTAADVSALAHGRNHFELFVAGREGQVELFDLRLGRAVHTAQHPLRLPVHSLALHASGRLVSADAFQLRISDPLDGSLFCVYESRQRLNAATLFGESGLLLLAQEAPQMGALFVPALAPAPAFCDFLEGVTEELEARNARVTHDEFVFVTAEELRALNGAHLLGTRHAQPHLHGFLLKAELHEQLRAAAPQFRFEEYKAQKIQEAVQQRLSAQILPRAAPPAARDSRFARLDSDRDFAVDERHESFRIRQRSQRQKARPDPSALDAD